MHDNHNHFVITDGIFIGWCSSLQQAPVNENYYNFEVTWKKGFHTKVSYVQMASVFAHDCKPICHRQSIPIASLFSCNKTTKHLNFNTFAKAYIMKCCQLKLNLPPQMKLYILAIDISNKAEQILVCCTQFLTYFEFHEGFCMVHSSEPK